MREAGGGNRQETLGNPFEKHVKFFHWGWPLVYQDTTSASERVVYISAFKIKVGWPWIEAMMYFPGLALIRQRDAVGLNPVLHYRAV